MGFPALRTHPSQGGLIQIGGFTRDSNGATIGGCTVNLFRTSDNVFIASTTSDSSGYFHIPATTGANYFLVGYLAGSPDVEGTTVNTLTAT